MQHIFFEWDEGKNTSNFKKHGIRFEEAAQIFLGPTATEIDDRGDYGEVREISIGLIGAAVCIIVIHTDREGTLRIISARRATRLERLKYDEYYQENTR